MADEMDLLSRVKDVAPLRAEAYEEARASLRAVIAAGPGTERESAGVPFFSRKVGTGGRGKAAVSIAAAVAVAAAAFALASSSLASRHVTAAGGRPAAGHASSAAPARKPAVSTVHPQLAQLAAYLVSSQQMLPGDASLEIRNGSPSSAVPGASGVDLVTDSGDYYWALTESGLPQLIADHQQSGAGMYQREMAAALYAVSGDIGTARARMAVANFSPGFNPNSPNAKVYPAGATPPVLTPEQQAEHTDNMIWLNCWNALNAGAGNPNVRAGVFRIMATMPLVTIKQTSTDGQRTLTLTDSWPALPGSLSEVLVINAATGLPVVSMTLQQGQPPAGVTYYHVSRVTLADIAAGRF